MSKQYSVRELQRMLKDNGYVHDRTRGSHQIWERPGCMITLPVVSLNYKLGNKIARQIMRG